MRTLVGVVIACAVPACEPRDCELAPVVDDFIAGETLVDCGAIPSPYDHPSPSAYGIAQRCVLAATAEQNNFVVRWNVQGIEGSTDLAYVGLRGRAGLEISFFNRGYSASGRTHPTSRFSCTRIEAVVPCETPTYDLCLRCVDLQHVETCEP